jgi:hypothetical protein
MAFENLKKVNYVSPKNVERGQEILEVFNNVDVF